MVAHQALLTALSGLAAGAMLPRAGVPSDNGFPMPNDQQKIAIAQQAGGLLPNAPSATSLGAGTTTAFQLIAFDELFETAYFQLVGSEHIRQSSRLRQCARWDS